MKPRLAAVAAKRLDEHRAFQTGALATAQKTLGSLTRMPIRRSSSRMRRWPQAGFSRLSVTMSSAMVSSSGGRQWLSVRRRSDRNRIAQRMIVVRGADKK